VRSRTADAHRTSEALHTWLGEVLGETIGYALTATFTILVAMAVTRTIAPRWMILLGYGSAAFIATGVVVPLGVSAATITNFVGYVAWCPWLIGMAAILWRANANEPATSAVMPSTATCAQSRRTD